MKPDTNLYQTIKYHLMNHPVPSIYLDNISEEQEFQSYPFVMLFRLKGTEQSPRHHPEGDAWKHTLLVVDTAAKEKGRSNNALAFMWAALLHDIGKPSTTRVRGGKITSYDHDKVGAELTRKFLSEFTDDEPFMDQVYFLVRYHMQLLFVLNDLPFKDIKGMKAHGDVREIALLGFCDRMGRTGANRAQEETNMKLFIEKCNRN
jgi:putative nucleotidyltransferase with HDIG domain